MSLRKAINDHCRSCSYDEKSGLGAWREQIEVCPCTSCSLFSVRPRTRSKRLLTKPVGHKSNAATNAEVAP